ncbi:MAG: GNAT family N-acetyltransferase, partial [Nitrospirales bacterium]
MPGRPVRPAYVPPKEAAAAQSGYLLLRDGSTALIRPASPEDEQALAEFFGRLSPESRRRRFHSFGLPPEDLVRTLCSYTDPAAGLTLLVIRTVNERPRILGVGTYQAREQGTAETSLAVDDAFQGKGLGTL